MFQTKKELRKTIKSLQERIEKVMLPVADLKLYLGDPGMDTEAAIATACYSIDELREKVASMEHTIAEQKTKFEDLVEKTLRAEKDLTTCLLETEKKFAETIEEYNTALAQIPATGECEGCVHSGNYRKCTSCARYPGLKDKYMNPNDEPEPDPEQEHGQVDQPSA